MDMGRVYWQPLWSNSLHIPILIKRTWVEELELGMKTFGHYDYYAVLSNFNLMTHSYQAVMEFYQKRGNAENMIREEQYGYDLKHFPWQSLLANHAFALLAMVAHNLLRWIARVEKPEKPHFSKKLTGRFIFTPGKIVRHARQLFLRIPENYKREVDRLKQAMTAMPLKPSLDTCKASIKNESVP